MQAIAAWLVTGWFNAPFALALTVSAGFLSVLSGATLVMLVLHKGPRGAMIDVAIAAPMAVLIAFLYQVPPVTAIAGAMAIWLPAMLLGVLLAVTRSVTLVLQLSVIIAVVAVTGAFLVLGDPATFWQGIIGTWIEAFREAGQAELAEAAAAQRDAFADQMTMLVTFAHWFIHTIGLVLGYKLYRALPGREAVYGHFRDLNLGRVIAALLAAASIVWMLADWVWMQSVAFVMFGAFWLQGLAMVHWLYGREMLPRGGVVLAYVMLLSVLLTGPTVLGLAVFGYIDAWFRLRRLPKTQN